ncbi:unnamed protein product [Amoebophrya sp. A120]|nr:unnamed protein product [Amoebophrya sp. A120]|eukprot:GSA120T00006195001.1
MEVEVELLFPFKISANNCSCFFFSKVPSKNVHDEEPRFLSGSCFVKHLCRYWRSFSASTFPRSQTQVSFSFSVNPSWWSSASNFFDLPVMISSEGEAAGARSLVVLWRSWWSCDMICNALESSFFCSS